MALRFQTRLALAVSGLITVTILVMGVLLVSFATRAVSEYYMGRGRLFAVLANRSIQHARKLPDRVMDHVGSQMVVSALLTAEIVSMAEEHGDVEDIERALERVIERSKLHYGQSIVNQFWVSQPDGTTLTYVDDGNEPERPDEAPPPQAVGFWPLLNDDGPQVLEQRVVRRPDLDDRYKYVGVTGADKRRIIQLGVGDAGMDTILDDFDLQNVVQQFMFESEVRQIYVFDLRSDVVASAGQPGDTLPAEPDPEVVQFCRDFLESPLQQTYAVKNFGNDLGVVTLLSDPLEGRQGTLFIRYRRTGFYGQLRQVLGHSVFFALIMLAFGIAVSMLLARGLARPVTALQEGARQFARGNLSYRVDLDTKTDIRQLGDAFNLMAESLQVQIKEVENQTQRRERLESELRIAAELQQSLLPRSAPYMPGLAFEGFSQPAKEVGGDFYDYVRFRNRQRGVLIGDAVGKGLYAALLTTECGSLLRALSGEYDQPSDLLERVNHVMHRRIGRTGRFVTLFVMVIDQEEGLVRYSQAGHNPPLLMNADRKRTLWLGSDTGLPLGVIDDCAFSDYEVRLEPGDTILLYSDGVTDALNPTRERYGVGRLRNALERNIHLPLQRCVQAVRHDVEHHIKDAPLVDDMTVVGVRYTGTAEPEVASG